MLNSQLDFPSAVTTFPYSTVFITCLISGFTYQLYYCIYSGALNTIPFEFAGEVTVAASELRRHLFLQAWLIFAALPTAHRKMDRDYEEG